LLECIMLIVPSLLLSRFIKDSEKSLEQRM